MKVNDFFPSSKYMSTRQAAASRVTAEATMQGLVKKLRLGERRKTTTGVSLKIFFICLTNVRKRVVHCGVFSGCWGCARSSFKSGTSCKYMYVAKNIIS